MMDLYWRKPQPSTWNDILLKRDGANSGTFVIIYWATSLMPQVQSSTPTKVLEQRPSRKNLKNFGVKEDRELSSGSEAHKEVLVAIKRGRRAQIMEQYSLRICRPRQSAMGIWSDVGRDPARVYRLHRRIKICFQRS